MTMLYIKNVTVFTPDEQIDEAAVVLDGARIAAVGLVGEIVCPEGAVIVDGSGLLLVPGFIDMQFNGGFGADFTAGPSAIWAVAAQLPRYGVTAFLPTIITSPLERVERAQQVLMDAPADGYGAEALGLHLEGPFLNPHKKGAHNPAYLRAPDLNAIRDWSPGNGVRLVTLAPELPGALDLVQALAARGVVVSAGHSMATYDEAMDGFAAGIRYGTHLFNAMPTLTHREPALPGALLTDPRPTVGFIADGVHTHPSVISLVWKALGSQRLNLVTDAMAALGMPQGKHILGDFDCWVDASSARLHDGTLAGSVLSLDEAVRNLIAFAGCTLAAALPTVTTTPARLLGLEHERGRIAPGYRPDLVLLSPDLHVKMTICAGKIVFEGE